MLIEGAIINLSNLVWTEDVGIELSSYSTFIGMDLFSKENVYDEHEDKYYSIYYDKVRIECCLAECPCYLATIMKDGKYHLEKIRFHGEQNGMKSFDVNEMPSQLNDLRFKRKELYQSNPSQRAFNQWGAGLLSEKGWCIKVHTNEVTQKNMMMLYSEKAMNIGRTDKKVFHYLPYADTYNFPRLYSWIKSMLDTPCE